MERDLKRIDELTFSGGFSGFYFLPFSEKHVQEAIIGGFTMPALAREHVLFCLVPAFFIAGR